MLDFLATYALFLLKAITIVAAILLIFSGIAAVAGKNRIKPREKISIRNLNHKYEDLRNAINAETLTKHELKELEKKKKEEEKAKKKKQKKGKKSEGNEKKRIFVLSFNGDVDANAVETLREEVTAVLTSAKPIDEVLVRVDSAGGVIHGYGLAASQLQRIRDRKIPLTVAVDKVAASGGYLMACVADKIVAAPFAIVGSIGVVAEIPNFNKLLKKHDVSYEQITAGEYKRTLSMFGENTPKGRKKMQEEVEEAHGLFKKFIATHRPKVSISKVSTGEHWYGTDALRLKLIDEIITSDDYLFNASNCEDISIYEITYTIRKSISEKFSFLAKAMRKGSEKAGLFKMFAKL